MGDIQILVAEDDDHIRTGIVDTLESEGYRAVGAKDGDEALAFFKTRAFDLILLDVMMPAQSGYEVCRRIRTMDEQVPIIMVTAKGEEIDKVVGLKLGADDYITKPFGVNEFLARVGAVLRRARQPGTETPRTETKSTIPDSFRMGAVEIDSKQYALRRGKSEFQLSARELHLLFYFHTHPNQVLSRDEILNAVWGVDYFGTTRTLDQHMAQLRKKVEADPGRPDMLLTVHGIGYRYRAPENP